MSDWIMARALMGEELVTKAIERVKTFYPNPTPDLMLAAALGIVWETIHAKRPPIVGDDGKCRHGSGDCWLCRMDARGC